MQTRNVMQTHVTLGIVRGMGPLWRGRVATECRTVQFALVSKTTATKEFSQH